MLGPVLMTYRISHTASAVLGSLGGEGIDLWSKVGPMVLAACQEFAVEKAGPTAIVIDSPLSAGSAGDETEKKAGSFPLPEVMGALEAAWNTCDSAACVAGMADVALVLASVLGAASKAADQVAATKAAESFSRRCEEVATCGNGSAQLLSSVKSPGVQDLLKAGFLGAQEAKILQVSTWTAWSYVIYNHVLHERIKCWQCWHPL
jgi:hypothetical protein